MVFKDDNVLDVLRGLNPESGEGAASTHKSPPANQEPGQPHPHTQERRRGKISLGVEEVGFVFFVATLLVVLAFLIGWYGRGISSPGKITDGTSTAISMPSTDGAAVDLKSPVTGVRPAREQGHIYSLLVKVYSAQDKNLAETDINYLKLNYSDVRLVSMRSGRAALLVGKFNSRSDPLLQSRLQNIKSNYPEAKITMVKVGRGGE